MSRTLRDYITLGRSGLRVSPLCLGAMTFGTEWGWGADEDVSRAIFNRYLEAGGNFIDTADAYTGGKSEELVGKFIAERGLRDRVVLATKFSVNTDPGNPNGGGNGRKNIYRALEASLGRLKTDFIDLYWLHLWDTVTPVDEVISTLTDLVRAGRIRYYGFSDTPAWYVARAQTLTEKEDKERVVALQLEYSLVERSIEREHLPAAQELGLGICPWSPLAGGFLSGKYKPDTSGSEGRLEQTKDSALTNKWLTDRNWAILDVVREIASQLGKRPAQVAINWVATRPGITSTIIGATKLDQLDDNLSAIEFGIPDELAQRLERASALEAIHPYLLFSRKVQVQFGGGVTVQRWEAARATGAPEGSRRARTNSAEAGHSG